jgi:hypothetical protein
VIFIENEGALFRGPSRSFPNDVWNPDNREFAPYTGVIPKPMELGSVISPAEALNMTMGATPTRTAESFARRRSGSIR